MNYYSEPHKTQFREAVYYVIDNDDNINNSIVASSYGHLLKYYFMREDYQKPILSGGGPFGYQGIKKAIYEKKPHYIWYINSHNFPTEEYAFYLYRNFNLSFIKHKRFLQVDVWLFHTPYLDHLDIESFRHLKPSYMGFYNPEKWPQKNYTWRWSKKEGIISIPKKGVTIELNMQCNHPDIKEDPVIVNLLLNNQPLDEITFTEGRRFVSKRYRIPDSIKGIPQLFLKVSRTWNPSKYGLSDDNRDLGVAVRKMEFIDKSHDEGIEEDKG
jgi:hypothetical protein